MRASPKKREQWQTSWIVKKNEKFVHLEPVSDGTYEVRSGKYAQADQWRTEEEARRWIERGLSPSHWPNYSYHEISPAEQRYEATIRRAIKEIGDRIRRLDAAEQEILKREIQRAIRLYHEYRNQDFTVEAALEKSFNQDALNQAVSRNGELQPPSGRGKLEASP
jgi:hypothetical protein